MQSRRCTRLHSLFDTTKRITLVIIIQLLLHRDPPYIWFKIMQIAFTRDKISQSRSQLR